MNIDLVICDFDGTLTNLEEEAKLFFEGYKEDLAKDLQIPPKKLQEQWVLASNLLEKNINGTGWNINGNIVAPAHASPFIYALAIAEIILNEEKKFLGEERQETLQKYFDNNYKKTKTCFKPETDNFLTEAQKEFNLYIITNSDPEAVRKKISEQLTNHTDIPIKGNAKKHVLTPEWLEVPDYTEKQGFNRPLFLRRQIYWKILQETMKEKSTTPNRTVVIGDSYELDLLLPEHKKMNIILTPNALTPRFEEEAVKNYERGQVAKNLYEAIYQIRKIK